MEAPNVTWLRPRQCRILADVAAGMRHYEAAARAGTSREAVTRLCNTTAGQGALLQMRQQAARTLAEGLSLLMVEAVGVLLQDLRGRDKDANRKAAQFILRTFGPELLASLDPADVPILLESATQDRDQAASQSAQDYAKHTPLTLPQRPNPKTAPAAPGDAPSAG